MHTHLNRDRRVALAALKKAGMNQSRIAKELGVHRSTISRELLRNAQKNGRYHSICADRLARGRRKGSKRESRLLENDAGLETLVEALLDPLVSPELIAHELGISHETIYAWISRSRRDLLPRLPQRGKKRRRYGLKRSKKQGWTRQVRCIGERPEAGENWEGDTVKGRTRARLLAHVERRSLYTVADLMPNGTADSVHAVLKKHQKISGTVTYDRGSEFALWQMIERDTGAAIYFADPHHPWQRGKNENTNGRLRRMYPKRFDFGTIRQRDLDAVVSLMNHTKRKSLSWRTPCSLFRGECCDSD
ncbi:MAG: IS30 family transposase [bacterium]